MLISSRVFALRSDCQPQRFARSHTFVDREYDPQRVQRVLATCAVPSLADSVEENGLLEVAGLMMRRLAAGARDLVGLGETRVRVESAAAPAQPVGAHRV